MKKFNNIFLATNLAYAYTWGMALVRGAGDRSEGLTDWGQ